jgi:hypothetical protein
MSENLGLSRKTTNEELEAELTKLLNYITFAKKSRDNFQRWVSVLATNFRPVDTPILTINRAPQRWMTSCGFT